MPFGGSPWGALLFFLIGLLDDLFGLSASSRLLMQAAIAAIAWHVGVSIDFFEHSLCRPGVAARVV